MRRRAFLTAAGWAACSRAGENTEPGLLVAKGQDWEGSSREDITALLRSVRSVFLRHLPEVKTPGLVIERTRDHPITFDRHDDEGRVRIGLDSGENRWAQFSFQFAHEMIHVLAGHVRARPVWPGTTHAHGWLEEALCETGSLFALRAMAEAWKTKAPYPNWIAYAPFLADYARKRMEDPRHALPEGETLAGWIANHRKELRQDCCQRENNTRVAIHLLPRFEREPEGWASLVHFRHGPFRPECTLPEFFAGWAGACPEKPAAFVKRLGDLLLG